MDEKLELVKKEIEFMKKVKLEKKNIGMKNMLKFEKIASEYIKKKLENELKKMNFKSI